MHISGHTDPGRRRPENQDAFIARPLWSNDKMLLVVVDGVGGYAGGEKAAAIARDSIDRYMQSPSGDTLTMLREALVFANNRIWEERKKDQRLSEMCCVLTAVVADQAAQSLCFAHVGDTRLYRFRKGILQKLTNDHSFVGIREDAGNMTEWEAMRHPHRHQILREAGSAFHRLDDEDFMDYDKLDLLPGDQLLLCSDGLTDMITSQQISTILSAEATPEEKASRLIARANEMGGYDNITVVVLQQPDTEPVAATGEDPETPAASPEISETPAATAPPAAKPAEKKERKLWLLWGLLPLALIALAGWYFSPPGKALPDHSSGAIIPATDSPYTPLPVRSKQPAVPGPPAPIPTDTLRLSATRNYGDIRHYTDSTGHALVLQPARPDHARFAAITITGKDCQPGDTLELRNLRLRHFETGIAVQAPVLLRTENIIFEDIRYPFRYPAGRDSLHKAVLFMNTVNQ